MNKCKKCICPICENKNCVKLCESCIKHDIKINCDKNCSQFVDWITKMRGVK